VILVAVEFRHLHAALLKEAEKGWCLPQSNTLLAELVHGRDSGDDLVLSPGDLIVDPLVPLSNHLVLLE